MEEILSKSTIGLRKAGLATLATTLVLGAGYAGAGSASALPGFNFDRIGGSDRYETSTLIADEFNETNADVILANGEPGSYADALTANYLAGEMNAPILLTRDDRTPDSVLAQLEEDGVQNIVVVGGESAINQSQVDALVADGYNVTRVSGSDRFKTNAEVIEDGGQAENGLGLIATGFNFPDALAGGPLSYKGHPLGLSTQNDIDDEVIAALKAAGVNRVLILGGESAVGAAVVAKLAANEITVERRFAGSDRSETSELVAEYALAELGFTDEHVNVASGYVEGYGADALAGGPLTGKQNRPLLITKDVNQPDDVLDFLNAHDDTLIDGIIFGGNAAISVQAQAQMEEAAQGEVQSNQSFTVNHADAQVVQQGENVQFTFSGITSETVDIALFNCDNVTTDENGNVSFTGTNPGGTGNTAVPGNTNSEITVVNGVAGGSADDANSADGDVNFTVTTANASECFVAVVFDDADNDDLLDLAPNGEPTEDFGVSGDVNVVPTEAQAGNILTGNVQDANTELDYFVQNGETFYYDSGDRFQLVTDNGNETVTQQEFEARISVGDEVRGDYAPDGSSRFALNDIAPAPATEVTATDVAEGIRINFTESATDTVVAYDIFRADAIEPTITGAQPTCPEPGNYQRIGSEQDAASGAEGADATFIDNTTVEGQNYCYYVVAIDETGDTSEPSNTAGPVEETDAAPAAPDTTDPVFTGAAVVGNSNVVTVTYDELIQCDTVDALASNYEVTTVDAQGNETARVESGAVCASPEDATVDGATEQADTQVAITVNGDPFVTDQVVRVRAVNGIDGNTVLDLQGQAQPVGDAVQTTTGAAPDTTQPTIASATANTADDTVTVVYTEAVDCDEAAANIADQFTYTGGPAGADNLPTTTTATSVTCDGTDTVVVGFATGGVDSLGDIVYTDDDATQLEANDVRDLANNQAESPDQATATA
jgi:putative cell wall-binding protein